MVTEEITMGSYRVANFKAFVHSIEYFLKKDSVTSTLSQQSESNYLKDLDK